MKYNTLMANISYRVTYAFDKKTAEEVDELAQRWNISKSAAVRQAIHRTLEESKKRESRSPQETLKLLRERSALAPGTGMRWMQEILHDREEDLSR